MSIDWFRSWHGAPTDNKWLLIAKRANVPAGVVSAVVWAMFDHASQSHPRGSVSDFDIETYATFSGFDETEIQAVIAALTDKGIILDGILSAWAKRQPKREDNSSDRVAAHREMLRNAGADTVTQCNASTDNVTQCNSREEKSREREERKNARESALLSDWPENYQDEFWQLFPNKVGKPAAMSKLSRIRRDRQVSWGDLTSGLARYIRDKPPDRPWLNPATFLNQERWGDRPAVPYLRRVPDV